MLFEGRIYVSTKLFHHKNFDSILLFQRKYIIGKEIDWIIKLCQDEANR